ncbi:MAG: hypothetical protein QNJ62_06680 [Methyloceanibacter sp.]|nr:hypothetical protein [Methyloceanibacter sp.]
MTSKTPKHWLRNLPECGEPLLKRAGGIEDLWKQIEQLQAQLAIAENEALQETRPDWSLKEVNYAHRYSMADAAWIERRQGFDRVSDAREIA